MPKLLEKAYYVDLISGNRFKLLGHNDYIRSATLNQSGNLLVTCGRDQLVQVYKLDNKSVNPLTVFKLDARATSVVIMPDNETIYAGTIYGSLFRISITTGKVKSETALNSAILSMVLSPDGRVITLGTADGMLHFIDSQGKVNPEAYPAGNCGVRQIVYHKSLNLLALSFDDKSIKIFNINNLDKNPINIRDLEQKVQQIGFVKDKLYALYADHSLQFWETDVNVYAQQVEKLINRNLTSNEWRIFVGDKVPYEQTKANK